MVSAPQGESQCGAARAALQLCHLVDQSAAAPRPAIGLPCIVVFPVGAVVDLAAGAEGTEAVLLVAPCVPAGLWTAPLVLSPNALAPPAADTPAPTPLGPLAATLPEPGLLVSSSTNDSGLMRIHRILGPDLASSETLKP